MACQYKTDVVKENVPVDFLSLFLKNGNPTLEDL